MKNKFSLFSDSFLTKFSFFIIGLIFGGYYLHSPLNRLLFSAVFCLCASEAVIRFFRRKHVEPIDKRFDFFRDVMRLSSQKHLFSLLTDAFSLDKKVVNNGSFLLVDDIAVTGKITYAPLNIDELVDSANTLKEQGYDKIIVVCDSFSDECKRIADKLQVKLKDYSDFFSLLKKKTLLPDLPKKPKHSLLRILRGCLRPNRASSLFACSIMLFAFSQVVGSSVFYIAVSVLCFALALASVILPKEN